MWFTFNLVRKSQVKTTEFSVAVFESCSILNVFVKTLHKGITEQRKFQMNQSQNRKIVFLRHGERCDNTFGSSWAQEEYVQTDLNMPESLPSRETRNWAIDTALTRFGEIQAQFVGSSLKKSGIKFTRVFVSPAYRCLETATGVLKGMSAVQDFPLNIDPGLFEWTGFLKGGLAKTVFLSPEEAANIFNVNLSYQPIMNQSQLDSCMSESIDEFYDRNHQTTVKIIEKCEGDILIVGHGIGLETYTRQLLSKEKRSWETLKVLVPNIPYLAAVAIEQTGSSFKLIEPPCMTVTHDSSTMFGKARNPIAKFDWRILESD